MTLIILASISFTLVTVLLIAVILARRRLLAETGGKVLAFFSICILPVIATSLGTNAHLEASKSTEFCLSCHEMQPYGETLWIEDQDYLPAAHFQNSRVPRDHACYACHTTYTMYGDVSSKWKGFRHLFIHFFGDVPEPGEIELYEPFLNRECLYCHGGARTFEENEFHVEYRDELTTSDTSCLECHEYTHPITELDELDQWEHERARRSLTDGE